MNLFRSDSLADWLGGEHFGPIVEWTSVASLDTAGSQDLAFMVGSSDPGNAGVLLCSTPISGRCCIVHEDPKYSFILIINELFHVEHCNQPTIDPTAVIHPGAVVMNDCTVGARTIVFPNAVLYPHTRIGADCRIHSGAVIGADGFGVHNGPNGPIKVPHIGGVEIADRVEIGANSTIDRGFISSTCVGSDTTIDNMVHIGHNCSIGERVLIAAQTGLSGSVHIGSDTRIGGQVGVVEHVHIGKGAQIGAQSGVMRNVADGQRVLGTPAQEAMKTMRMYAALQQSVDMDASSD